MQTIIVRLPLDVEGSLELAEHYWQKDKFEFAVTILEQLKQHPNIIKSEQLRVITLTHINYLIKSKRIAEAEEHLAQAQKLFPQDKDFERLKNSLFRPLFTAKQKKYIQLQMRDPIKLITSTDKFNENLVKLRRQYPYLPNYSVELREKAKQNAAVLSQLGKKFPSQLFKDAVLCFEQKNYLEALRYFEAIHPKASCYREALLYSAQCLILKPEAEPAKAMKYLDAVIAQGDICQIAKAHFWRGQAYQQQKQYQHAIGDYEKALLAYANDTVKHQLVNAHYIATLRLYFQESQTKNDSVKAMAILDKLLQATHFKETEFYVQKALLLLEQNQLSAAIENFTQGIPYLIKAENAVTTVEALFQYSKAIQAFCEQKIAAQSPLDGLRLVNFLLQQPFQQKNAYLYVAKGYFSCMQSDFLTGLEAFSQAISLYKGNDESSLIQLKTCLQTYYAELSQTDCTALSKLRRVLGTLQKLIPPNTTLDEIIALIKPLQAKLEAEVKQPKPVKAPVTIKKQTLFNQSTPKINTSVPNKTTAIKNQLDDILNSIPSFAEQHFKDQAYQKAFNLLEKHKPTLGAHYEIYRLQILRHPIARYETKLNQAFYYQKVKEQLDHYLEQGEFSLAHYAIDKLLGANSSDVELGLKRVKLHYKQKQYQTVANICDEILERPEISQNSKVETLVHYYRGVAHFYLGQYANITSDLGHVLKNRQHLEDRKEQAKVMIVILKVVEDFYGAQRQSSNKNPVDVREKTQEPTVSPALSPS